VKPFDEPDVRWALSHYVDRQQIIQVAYLGAETISTLPMPPYKPLLPYFEAVKDLLAKYNTIEFNPKKGDALLAAKGFKKKGAMWEGPDGKPFTIDIIGFGAAGSAMGPVLSAMLKRHGVAASMSLPPDFDERFQKGEFVGSIYGHGGSIREPYDTLRLYQGKSIAVPGAHLVNFSRWHNPEYDKIVDEVYITDPHNVAKLKDLFRAAMEIWLPALPDIQLVQNYHRIPYNLTNWKNYPTDHNSYINSASWHLTFNLVLWNLQPVQT
jgi:peptide/nickel transport system substrate-binding protein